jgi:hypothetical protein
MIIPLEHRVAEYIEEGGEVPGCNCLLCELLRAYPEAIARVRALEAQAAQDGAVVAEIRKEYERLSVDYTFSRVIRLARADDFLGLMNGHKWWAVSPWAMARLAAVFVRVIVLLEQTALDSPVIDWLLKKGSCSQEDIDAALAARDAKGKGE